MPTKPKLKLMVASTVYHFEDQLRQICTVLNGFGHEVWNSHAGAISVKSSFRKWFADTVFGVTYQATGTVGNTTRN